MANDKRREGFIQPPLPPPLVVPRCGYKLVRGLNFVFKVIYSGTPILRYGKGQQNHILNRDNVVNKLPL